MLGSVLVGLDGSSHSRVATQLGLHWAKKGNALLGGIAVLDEPSIRQGEPVPLGGATFKENRDKKRMEHAQQEIARFFNEFEEGCKQSGVACKTIEGCGDPAEEISTAAQEFDLVILGLKTFFHFETEQTPCDTLTRVIHDSVRPVVAVPEKIPQGTVTLIAYDGSLQSARALQAYQAAGLDTIQEVHVVTIQDTLREAQVISERAKNFLHHNKIEAKVHPIASTDGISNTLLKQVDNLKATLLVMGAYGRSTLMEFFFGSVTKELIEKAKVPLFLYH